MSEILADSKHTPAAIVGGRRVSISRRPPHTKPHNDQPPPSSSSQEERVQTDYPRPSPPPTFAAEHGLPIEPRHEHRGPSYAASPRDVEPGSSPKASFMHLHKSEVGRR
ncbi:hypothetical protein FRC08_002836 [Ceratobasidium sp. 394]|nr:hypothetical protein FRC08_002836 [Ceratobasidium sp. 394]KAG9093722.1 hypothetical protein FS749_013872 [Ceratobasidium sp. UAMH 11750]